MQRRRHRLRTIALVTALVLAPAISWADYCITFLLSPNYVLVGRNFTPPRPGHCKPWTGFTFQENTNSPSSGTACLSSDGTNLAIAITTQIRMYVLFDNVSLQMPSGNGGDIETLLNFGGEQPLAVANGAKCGPTNNAIPANPFPFGATTQEQGPLQVGLIKLR